MGEPLSLAVNVIRLVTNAFMASRDVHSAVEAISNAPKHIKAIAGDLEDFYSILGSLKGYLEDVEMSAGVLQAAEKVNIASVIENCLQIFTRINLLASSYNSRGRRGGIGDMGNWRKIKYSFKIAETEALRSQLAAHKMTLNMAISLVNFINLNTANINAQQIETEIANHMRELEEKLPILSWCLEDVAADALPRPQNHSRSDRDQLLEDYDFTIRRYLDGASSMILECCTPDTASIQISSLGTADSLHISTGSAYISIYETAKTHISEGLARTTVMEDDENYEDECTQIFVKGPHDHTTVLHVDSSFTLEHIHEMLRLQTETPEVCTDVFYTYGGQILNEARQLRHYKIPQNATIFCNLRVTGGWFERNFLSNTLPATIINSPVEEFVDDSSLDHIFVKMLTGRTIPLHVDEFKIDSSIDHMRSLIQDKVGIPPGQQRLICAGRQLNPANHLEDYGIGGGNAVYLVQRVGAGYTSETGETSYSGSVYTKSGWRSKLSAVSLFPQGARVRRLK